MHPILLVAFESHPWTINTGILMLFINLLMVFLGRYAIKYPGQGPALPIGVPDSMKDFGVPEMLATGVFAHWIGAGMILGLRSAGAL
ncbi:photosystem I reaction center subunit PsaK [Acaryochloris marina NIES-2412]|uniref:photosystem I reaction center subunit PsaK n=1 Tax=Acaryochloris marina TaxID=155978 RepID=UPI0040587044